MAKVAFLFHLCCGLVSLVAVVGLWFIADRIGTRDQIESFLGDLLGTKDFQLFGDKLFRAALGVTGALILLATIGTVVMAFLYNMLSSIFGGVVVSVLQERVPLPKDVLANAAAAQAEATPGQRRRRRRRRRRKVKAPQATLPLVYEPPVAGASGSHLVEAAGALPADARGVAASFDTSAPGDAINDVWAPEEARASNGGLVGASGPTNGSASGSNGSTPDGDDWIAAASDPTGSWMAPGSRS